MIEAAIVMPAVILVVAGLISIGFRNMEAVKNGSQEHRFETKEYLKENSLRAEDYLKIRFAGRDIIPLQKDEKNGK